MDKSDTPDKSGLYKHSSEGESWEGAFSAFGEAITAITRNFTPALLYVLVVAIIETGFYVLYRNHAGYSKQTKQLAYELPSAVLTLAFLPYLIRYELALAKNKAITIEELCQVNGRLYLTLITIFFMQLILIIVGTVLLVFPLIWVLSWTLLIFYPAVDRGYGPTQSLKEVMRLVEGRKKYAWGIIGICIVCSIVLVLLAGIPGIGDAISVLFSIIYQTAAARFYFWLKSTAPPLKAA